MTDQRFYTPPLPLTLQEVAQITQSDLADPAHGKEIIKDVGSLEETRPQIISFFQDKKYLDALQQSKITACFISPELAPLAPHLIVLLNKNPRMAFAKLATHLYPFKKAETAIIAPSAVIHPSCKIGKNVSIGAYTIIDENVEIGEDTHIESHVTIKKGVTIGKNGYIGSHVSLAYCQLGHHIIIHPGTKIGQDGYGYVMTGQGHVKIPQLGRVIIEDHVEIGANTCIDRGAIQDTLIGSGTKIDNLVQIAHNVQIGKNCIIVAQVGIAGSAKIGNFVVLAGQVAVADHATVGDGAQVAGQSGVLSHIDPMKKVMGYPATDVKEFFKGIAFLRKMVKKEAKK